MQTVGSNFFKPKVTEHTGTITIIGPRSSGKTTYLAGLAYFPQKSLEENKNNPKYEVRVGDSKDALNLVRDAKNILFNGGGFKPTVLDFKEAKERPKSYDFTININHPQKETISLQTTDFPGEGLEKITDKTSEYREYLEERLTEKDSSFLILLSNWEDDNEISETIQVFKDIISFKVAQEDWQNLRFAVAMNKCERGELWPSRIEPEMDLFHQYLPNTTYELYQLIKQFGIPKENLKFFAMSTFGVIRDDDPRPNRKDEIKIARTASDDEVRVSTLKEPKLWKPYGMISPLYWLATKKRLSPDV
ncbi:hypothetical protein B9G53_08835 [Pseudanabaena sp. SR411]|uniref:hypothetical protein n=1 Tax=Pseudanabaena sp. SR411 TaxID=1980935 RepID=UPI000B99AB6E|nr:hypothetical protein [Pseudanabaena sp. SR411]OYQ65086.1 hypothetical protein B9G53_08835 [Pseudanabaena sp. SR411]